MTLVSAASRAATKARSKGRPAVWWVGFRQTADEIAIPMPPVKKSPLLWGTTLWNLLRDAHGRPPRIPRGPYPPHRSGSLRPAAVARPATRRRGFGLRLVGVWHPRLPPHAAVFAVELLTPAALAGVAVAIDITTGAPPAWTARAVQVPQHGTPVDPPISG